MKIGHGHNMMLHCLSPCMGENVCRTLIMVMFWHFTVLSILFNLYQEDERMIMKGSVQCLFVLRFYGPVNPMGSCQARQFT